MKKRNRLKEICDDSIPKGLHHSAQGCRACEATLGYRWKMFSNPERVASKPGDDATPLGLMNISMRLPRVARSSQPWAERLNPVGILGDTNARQSVTVDFAPLKNSHAGELAAKFDIVMGVTPEA